MNWREHIISDKGILLGKLIIKGTRISVELILDLLSNGWSEKMLFESYPRLTENDLKAVFAKIDEYNENRMQHPCARSHLHNDWSLMDPFTLQMISVLANKVIRSGEKYPQRLLACNKVWLHLNNYTCIQLHFYLSF